MGFSYFQTAALNETPKEVLNWRLYWSTFVFGKSFLAASPTMGP